MTDPELAEQVAYYRRRAPEYDATSYGDLGAARRRIARLTEEMRPEGRVLEIACGTGMWTETLAAHADEVLAVDAAPEALQIARRRTEAANVTFERADIFDWHPETRFDTIFFSAWLSHVPERRFDEFWGRLAGWSARVLFVDEPAEEDDKPAKERDKPAKEKYVGNETVERRLTDGTSFRIVKNFIDRRKLERDLDRLGWTCVTRQDDDTGWSWVYGEARLRTGTPGARPAA
ncbi:methyltransferase domain-containing protein [Actinoplanes sp. NPDC051411]|uniref:class I SAM-dependent methyltransferase n=1 Tax=Actinoplanes sp. NPDC051411 TaxID=3155522 RepID=UPI00343CAD2F